MKSQTVVYEVIAAISLCVAIFATVMLFMMSQSRNYWKAEYSAAHQEDIDRMLIDGAVLIRYRGPTRIIQRASPDIQAIIDGWDQEHAAKYADLYANSAFTPEELADAQSFTLIDNTGIVEEIK